MTPEEHALLLLIAALSCWREADSLEADGGTIGVAFWRWLGVCVGAVGGCEAIGRLLA